MNNNIDSANELCA